MNARLIEFFQSIQGEGKYAGVKQVFVRFFECNMHCVWCDTPHSIGDTTRHYKEMSLGEVFAEIQKYWPGSHSVSLTGGEPLLQYKFIKELLPMLNEANMPAHLETNGVLPDELSEVIDRLDVVSMDLKLPSSTQCRPYWEEHRKFLTIARKKEVFVKTVVSLQTDEADIKQSVDMVYEVDPDMLFILQPNTFDLGNGVMNLCQKYETICSRQLSNVRILPQIHKIMKVR
ncbi:MAG: 7-carboxy-7-deazaguanine synthase QueE [Candidatus Omnitrophota bacterium]